MTLPKKKVLLHPSNVWAETWGFYLTGMYSSQCAIVFTSATYYELIYKMERQGDSFVSYKAVWRVEVRRHTFLTSQLRGLDLSVSLLCRLSASDSDRSVRWIEGCLVSRCNLDDSKKKGISFHCQQSKQDSLVFLYITQAVHRLRHPAVCTVPELCQRTAHYLLYARQNSGTMDTQGHYRGN
jgi:hypothetical protein